MKIKISSQNRDWAGDAEVLSKELDDGGASTDEDPSTNDDDWLAFEALRRPRARGALAVTRLVPRTWVALVRFSRLEQALPAPAGETATLEIELDSRSPALACVLDTPLTTTQDSNAVLDATASAIALDLAARPGQVPTWVKSLKLRRVRPGGTTTTTTTFDQVASTVLGAVAGSVEQVTFDADGLRFVATRTVPWWDATRTRRAIHRLLADRSASPVRWSVALERAAQGNEIWSDSLRRFQTAAVLASARARDPYELPSATAASVGLLPAALPDELIWRWSGTAWAFDPGAGLFGVELRGVADGVARWAPSALAIELVAGGVQVTATSATLPVATPVRYAFDRAAGVNLWSADLELVPIAETLASALALLGDGSSSGSGGEPASRAWVLTETGALALPFDPPPASAPPVAPLPSVLEGALTLCEVPWADAVRGSDAEPLPPPFPDLGAVDSGRLFLFAAGAARARFRLATAGAGLALDGVELTLDRVHVRAEECLALFAPAPGDRGSAGPPPLPKPELPGTTPGPGTAGGVAGEARFLDLPLDHRSGVSVDGVTRFSMHAELRPGRQQARREAAWVTRDLQVRFPTADPRAVYWFRPDGLRWLPSLPWDADPRTRPEARITATRVLFPLRPVTAAQPVVLGRGATWFLPVLAAGRFTAFAAPSSELPRPFTWVTPDLPGMSFSPSAEQPLLVTAGRLAGGPIEWALRAGLPLLDELHALRVLDTRPGKPGGRPLTEVEWWARLAELAALAQARRDRFFAREVQLTPGDVLRTTAPVTVGNLYAAQAFAGTASVDVVAGTGALSLTAGDGTAIEMMASPRLLEGLSGRFAVASRPEGGSPVLAPSASPAAPLELRANSLPPQRLEGQGGAPPMVFDQSGRTSSQLVGPAGRGRAVAIPPGEPTATPAAPAGALEPYVQWTSPVLELSGPGVSFALTATALPVGRVAGRWAFVRDSRGDLDDVLREYRWASVGPVRLFGLELQLFRLDRVAFPAGAATPDLPDELVVSGVLHARPGAIRLADGDTQLVTLTFQRAAQAWSLQAVSGRVVWPLFDATPDGADAVRADLADPLPWIEAPVELITPGASPVLRLGFAEAPAVLVFRFLDRSWSAAIDLAGGGLGAAGAGELLHWQVRPDPRTTRSELRVTGGAVALDRRALPEAATTIELELTLGPAASPPLVDLDLALTLLPRKEPAPSLRRARLLATTATTQLVSLEQAAVTLRAGRLAVAASARPGFRAGLPPFPLLPGWPVDDATPLFAYVAVSLVAPPGSGRVTSALVGEAQLQLETAVLTPSRLDTTLSMAVTGGGEPRFQLALTGQLAATSDLTWPTADGQSRWRHDAVFTLHQAILPGERLRNDPLAFFAPRLLPAAGDPSGLGGMIEVPCLASHRLREEGSGRSVASFTAAQRLRLGAPDSFAQELSLRGARRVEELAVRRRPSSSHWFEYREASEVEQGFIGPLGGLLADVWRNQVTMVLEATEAFWLRLAPGLGASRDPEVLWRRGSAGVACVPTRAPDFAAAGDWVRVPVPFVTDSRGLLRAARDAAPTGELARLLGNRPRRVPTPPGGSHPQLPLPRHALLHRRELDRRGLGAAPPRPALGEAIDPVLLQPDAHERWLPFLRAWPGFEPGWLTFVQWHPGAQSADYAVPFSATAEALAGLAATATGVERLCLAATEVVPETDPSLPRLLPSPALELRAANAAIAGEEVRLLVELWHPGREPGLLLLARAVFSFAIPAATTWSELLFGDPGEDRLRAALPRWLAAQQARIPATATALVRARALSPVPQLAEPTAYLLLDREREATPPVRARRDRLAPRTAILVDLHLEPRTAAPLPDALALGPDFLAARVFYKSDTDVRPPDELAVAGNAVGLAYKIAGVAPGPRHRSRLPRSHPGAGDRRWIEAVRDQMFVDRTRRDPATRHEPGWLLPAARPLPALLAAHQHATPFLPTQVTHLYTAGRPGELTRLRLSLLTEEQGGLLRRGASLAHELRFPRPAPLPSSLRPFHPAAPGQTALVEPLPPRPPFAFASLKWQDPIYNRRLLAVPQETEGDGLTLVLDRSTYAGVDVLYPELRWSPPPQASSWSISATLRILREQAARLSAVAQLSWTIGQGGLVVRDGRGERPVPAARDGQALRWVLELGLAQPEPLQFDAAIDLEAHDRDVLVAEAVVRWTAGGVTRTRTINLRGLLRTDLPVWPQPQAAYGILRTRGARPQELAAFGWLPRPLIVRRADRFVPESWKGTFRYLDTWIAAGDPAPVVHEVATYTAYGEQLAPSTAGTGHLGLP